MDKSSPQEGESWISRKTRGLRSILSLAKRARRLRLILLFTMLLIALLPLGVTVGLSFYQYRRLIIEETHNNVRWSANSTRQAIEAFLDKLETTVLVINNAYTLEELADPEILDQIFSKLRAEHDGLVDMSLIGPDGIQKSYSGPFDLSGKNYSESTWFQNALTRKIYVSEVFLGYRNIPHFVIAASKRDPKGRGYWVFRVSIDTLILDQFLESMDTEAVDDIFLINEQGKLQSSSRYYGEVTDQASLRLMAQPKKTGTTLMVDQREDHPLIRAVSFVQGSPLILVLDHQRYFHRTSWITFRNQLISIFFTCTLLAVIIVFWLADYLARNIQKTNESREMLLQQTEHTSKLASIGRLAAGVAHEINNPLSIINEKAGLMKDLLQRTDDFRHRDKFIAQLDALEKAVQRSRVITHRLLGFARRMEVSLESLQVAEVIEEVLGFLTKEAAYRNIKIEKFFEPDLPDIQSDRGQLQQVFLNIINNAIDAVADGGEISIACQKTGQGIQVDISDNGPGIPPEIMKNIFEPFFTTKRGKGKEGTGLGLSITYGLVKKLGGEISVRSEGNVGTTFSMTFPLVQKRRAEG
ncbi:MAG: sensor histidine kinase [Desulfobulbaceae bacterium]